MKTHAVKQGSDEWLWLRLGVPSASNFKRIIQPVKMKAADGWDDYIAELCAERFLRSPLEPFVSGFVQRGTDLEPEAVSHYEFLTDTDTQVVGWCTTDDGSVGCSPDRLVGDEGLAEIKCPSAKNHMGYLLDPESLRADHKCQTQGQLWVTGRKWCDLMAYNPILPSVRVRVEPDPAFQAALTTCLVGFTKRLRERLDDLGPAIEARKERMQQEAATGDSGPF